MICGASDHVLVYVYYSCRHQFPTPQKGSNSPSIPTWQRATTSSASINSAPPLPPQVKENGTPTSGEDEEEEDARVEKETKGLHDDEAPLVDGETAD